MTLFNLRRRAPAAMLATVLAASVLAGCATTSGPRSAAVVAPYSDNIALGGGISIHYSKDGKRESLIGKFTWQQTKADTDVNLISPTGQILAVINVTPGLATLKQSGKEPRTASDLDSLTAQALGWTLPVSGLREWLQGYATDASGKRFVASPANDTVITRDGWKVEYATWQDDKAAVPQPKLIDLTRLGAGQVDDLTIRIAIRPNAE
ncbi:MULTISPECIES: outer membrane lipoprotein LolB [unclassified Duganella]|uniref:outer membrane lipoprotein LolB n=1 Tax=unclassified Duganella TaxID=2636909 RepID=UPI000E34C50A|nr:MULTISPECIES: outer membrane lipoprotein LolB [unclassified Duganella]RFP10148.1 outer membrane lipoprotein LolB [Duganella sp. BJB475]RFP25546.1 outer membrane lipoprotein LolB [Duganella sp. BJB476]